MKSGNAADSPDRGIASLTVRDLAGKQLALLLAILAVSFGLRIVFLHEPFERDEGGYAYVAQEVLRGGIPYKDVIDIKPPAVYCFYAAGMKIFGETTEGIRIFTALYSLATVLAVFLVARYVSGMRAGLIAAFLYGILSPAPLMEGSGSNTEVFLVFPLALGTYFLARAMDTKSRKHVFLCGVLYAVAMLVKTVAFPFAAMAALFVLSLLRTPGTAREMLTDMAALLAGPVVLASIVLAYFSLHGALEDFLYWNLEYPFLYPSANVSGPPFFAVARLLLPEFLPLLVAGVPGCLLLLKERGRKEWIVAASFPAALMSVVLPGKNFPHYFIQLVPPLAILAGIGLARLFETGPALRFGGALVFFTMLSVPVYAEHAYYLDYSPNEVSESKHGPTFVQSLDVARYLKQRTDPPDYIFQWGFEMELYFLASRRAPVPYMASVLVGWSKDPKDAARRMVEGINRKKPKYIVFQEDWGNCAGLVELSRILAADYRFEKRIAYARIFRRK